VYKWDHLEVEYILSTIRILFNLKKTFENNFKNVFLTRAIKRYNFQVSTEWWEFKKEKEMI
jgi:hypothetical protein